MQGPYQTPEIRRKVRFLALTPKWVVRFLALTPGWFWLTGVGFWGRCGWWEVVVWDEVSCGESCLDLLLAVLVREPTQYQR